MVPNARRHAPGLTQEEILEEEEQAMQRVMEGPFMFAAVGLQGARDRGLNLLGNVLASRLMTELPLQAKLTAFGSRVVFVMVVAGGVAFMIHWLHRISRNFSAGYTLLGFADLLVGWLLAGLVVAKVAVR